MERNKQGEMVIPCIPDTFHVMGKRKVEEVSKNDEVNEHEPPKKKRKIDNFSITMDDDEDDDDDGNDEDLGEEFESYGKIAVDDFGIAMLMGMGYKKGKGYGRSSEPVKPMEQVRLPKLSGLGSVPLSKEDLKTKESDERGKNQRPWEEYLLSTSSGNNQVVVNSMVSVTRGPYEGLLGRILSINIGKRKNLCKVRLNLPNKLEADIKTDLLDKMSIKNVPSMHPSRLFARSEFITEPENEQKVIIPPPPPQNTNSSSTTANRDQPSTTRSKKNKKKKRRKHRWVTENIHVRIVSKTYSKGKYYKEKGVVIDIPDPYKCSVQLDRSRTIVNGIAESMIETILPKKTNSKIIFVMGKYRGKTGKLVQKDRKKYIAFIQLDEDETKIVKVSFDDICEKSVGLM